MRKLLFLFPIACLVASSSVGAAGPRRQLTLAQVAVGEAPPRDLAEPEGKSRWDLTGAVPREVVTRTLEQAEASILVREEAGPAAEKKGTSLIYSDPNGGAAALRWLEPHRNGVQLRPGSREVLVLTESHRGEEDRLRIDTEIVGIGWVHLPSGPREVVLERALIDREARDGAQLPRVLMHRWIDPRVGVVAEAWGPASTDGRRRIALTGGTVLEAVVTTALPLKIYVNQVWINGGVTFQVVNYGWEKGVGTTVPSLTPQAYPTIGALIASNSWDFSTVTSGTEVGSTRTPVSESCNATRCGYNVPGGTLDRVDFPYNDPPPSPRTENNTVSTYEDRSPTDVTIWLRAGAQKEGTGGIFGAGESRFCYITDGTGTRTPVPLWRFSHNDNDGRGYYFVTGDSWTGGPFNCEQNIFNQNCGGFSLVPKLWSRACGTHAGNQSVVVVKDGVVTLPSGHTLNALLVKNVADFCVYSASSCSDTAELDRVHTVVYLWQVPYLGTVVQLQSAQDVPDDVSFTTVDSTNIGFGLFPPRSITATGRTDTSVSLSWDPGLDTHRISGYKIYWDTNSGTPYAFNSAVNAGQVSFGGTTATISGLPPGVTHYFTVTSLSNFKDPDTLATTTYESILYPTQVSGDPGYVYPVEVQDTTTCTPTGQVQGLTVNKAGGNVEICWQAATDPCLLGYRVLGAGSPASDASFVTLGDTGTETCWTGNPAQSYFLVVARGTGATGPWGAYGH